MLVLVGQGLARLQAQGSNKAAAFSPQQVAFFEKQVQPLLRQHCWKCHGEEPGKLRGGMDLRTRSAILQGGDSGPAVDLRQPDKSLLLQAVHYKDEHIRIPPKGKLSEAEIAILEKWVKDGLPVPTDRMGGGVKSPPGGHAAEEAKKYWAYQPVRRPSVPAVRNTSWVRTPIDAFILARRVGPGGFVYGVDMTPEQVAVARRWAPEVARRFGYAAPNTAFVEDYIEVAATVPDESIDLVVSDCVVNLSPRKDLVFQTIRRVLKEGGEFSISDIVADRRLPEHIREDPELVAECLGGAMYEADWFDCMEESGFRDVRVVERAVVQTEACGEPVVFSSLTVRGFKFREPLDRRCEDYGQTAVYRGNVPGCEARFVFDGAHVFEARRPTPVCRNTARMLSETRLARYFEVTPPRRHFGAFRCEATQPARGPAARSCC
ncbi:MAG: methyltransferase domain-containing protein [Bryobacteraceae bacterium]|nr:methyltransferase domain-containing protein [Bryobacteraceae bacterium]